MRTRTGVGSEQDLDPKLRPEPEPTPEAKPEKKQYRNNKQNSLIYRVYSNRCIYFNTLKTGYKTRIN